MSDGGPAADALSLLDWRRRVSAMYAQVRAIDDPVTGHAHWRTARDELFAAHLTKPVEWERLRAEIEKLTAGRDSAARSAA